MDSRGRSFLCTSLWGFNGANAEQEKLPQVVEGLVLSGGRAGLLDTDALANFFLICFLPC